MKFRNFKIISQSLDKESRFYSVGNENLLKTFNRKVTFWCLGKVTGKKVQRLQEIKNGCKESSYGVVEISQV